MRALLSVLGPKNVLRVGEHSCVAPTPRFVEIQAQLVEVFGFYARKRALSLTEPPSELLGISCRAH